MIQAVPQSLPAFDSQSHTAIAHWSEAIVFKVFLIVLDILDAAMKKGWRSQITIVTWRNSNPHVQLQLKVRGSRIYSEITMMEKITLEININKFGTFAGYPSKAESSFHSLQNGRLGTRLASATMTSRVTRSSSPIHPRCRIIGFIAMLSSPIPGRGVGNLIVPGFMPATYESIYASDASSFSVEGCLQAARSG